MSGDMKTTPEKVKSLLSSFLASSRQQTRQKHVPESRHQLNVSCRDDAESAAINLRSFDSFLERLDTFSPLTWFGKPLELSPLICARYGWANVETNGLQCVGCKVHLCGKLPNPSDAEAYKSFKEKLKKNILASHDKFCVLAANPCPEHFCLISCDDPTSLLSGFTNRVSSLEAITNSLPSIDYSTLHTHGYDEGQGAAYCKRLLLPDCDTSPEVVALAVTGWCCMPSSTDILMCSKCRRQIGLWNFDKASNNSLYDKEDDSVNEKNGDDKKDDSVNEKNGDDKEPDAKRPKILVKSSFNPVEEHKHWCPWIQLTLPPSDVTMSSKSPSIGRKRAREEQPMSHAFIVALKVMAPGLMDNNTGLAHAMKVSPVADGLRCFRRVVKAWSSPKSAGTVNSPPSTKTSS